jgi:pimeloyl-ACP methyl ester carboxylesterase
MSGGILTIPSGRAKLAVAAAGDGPGLVFLHAGVADLRMWAGQMATFAKTHRVVAYDRRGFGRTRYAAEPHSFLDDLDAVLRATTQGPVTLVGCSQGGRIAIDFALTQPERVQRLVLVAPAVTGAPTPHEFSPAIQQLVAQIEVAEAAEDIERLNALEARAWLDGPLVQEGRVGGAVRTLFLDMNGRALRSPSAGDETSATNAYARFAELYHDILFISGEFDFPHINERTRFLASIAKNVQHVEMRGVAHLPSLEQPDAFNALAREFVA